ncbi:MAG TPA: nucleotide exchange factor GrpE [Pirellulales bacterium]|jgi:molecular chaperone GrpE|nr:nucleotide exchange factor GrpE [Pirellulales bacterium]
MNSNDQDFDADDETSRTAADTAQSGNHESSAANKSQDAGSQDIDSLQIKAAELQDRLLRTQAELENYRKRSRRELDEQRRYAEIDLIRDLLPLLDNVDRAISAAEKQADANLLLSGLKMMRQQLNEVFQKHHAKVISAAGEPFDPSRHEAVMQQPSEEHPEHTVVGVARQGLTLHDRVVRPAQVIVSKKPH